MPLYLSEDDVSELLDMDIALAAMEQLFREWGDDRAENTVRQRVRAPGVMLHTLSGACEYLGRVGLKTYTTTKSVNRFLVLLFDTEGRLDALIEADLLGRLRTGAVSGLATAALARPDAESVGLFGAGRQARTQLKAVCTVRRIRRVEVYSRDEARLATFCDEMSEYCRTEVIPCRWPGQIVTGKDIVITATTSRTPLFDGHLLDEGTHLNVVGSNHSAAAEIDVTTIARSDARVCDDVAACRVEAGDFYPAVEAGVLEWSQLRELKNVLAGRETGRATAADITLFKSVGLAIEDVALAAKTVELARVAGVGRSVDVGS